MIIFSTFRALGVMLIALLVIGGADKIAPHTVLPGIATLLVGAGLVVVGRMMSASYSVAGPTGPRTVRERHTVMFIPVWFWGVIALVAAIPVMVISASSS